MMGSTVYNQAIVYKRQNFHKVVVHAIVIDQRKQTDRFYKIQVTVIYSRAFFVAVTSVLLIKGYL